VPYISLQISPHGLVCDALVGITPARLKALTAAKKEPPKRVSIRALIDTGASCTCIDPKVAERLDLDITGRSPMNTASTGDTPVEANQYDVSLLIPHTSPDEYAFYLPTIPVAEMELLGPLAIHVLIGRDVLDRCLLIYDGKSQQFTISY
jgi:hypothetical protein